MPHKVHLRIVKRGYERPACNARRYHRLSNEPGEVTCLTCPRTMHMAEAELRQAQQPKRNRLFPDGDERRSNQ